MNDFSLIVAHTRLGCFLLPMIVVFVVVAVTSLQKRSKPRRTLRNRRASAPTCPRCSTVNRPVARYCANCGQKLR